MEHRHSLAQNDHGEDDEHDKQDEHDEHNEENEVSFEQGDSNRETSPETSVDTMMYSLKSLQMFWRKSKLKFLIILTMRKYRSLPNQ